MDKMKPSKSNNQLFGKIADLLAEARKFVVKSVNQTIVRTYFKVGRLIVEDEQQGKERAGYGKTVLKELSNQLTKEFGKGYSVTNLQQMRKFYMTYLKQQTVSVILILKFRRGAEVLQGINFRQSQKFIVINLHQPVPENNRVIELTPSIYYKLYNKRKHKLK